MNINWEWLECWKVTENVVLNEIHQKVTLAAKLFASWHMFEYIKVQLQTRWRTSSTDFKETYKELKTHGEQTFRGTNSQTPENGAGTQNRATQISSPFYHWALQRVSGGGEKCRKESTAAWENLEISKWMLKLRIKDVAWFILRLISWQERLCALQVGKKNTARHFLDDLIV